MNRRTFIEKIIGSALAIGGVLLFAGCRKNPELPRSGNQEKLWNLATNPQKTEEPLELPYAKDTPAFYRDASLGKADPSFAPKTGGG
jgi:hypothetical protein